MAFEESIPVKKGVRTLTEMLGVDLYTLACEGRFVCIASPENASLVAEKLQKYNKNAGIIGEVTSGNLVVIQTMIGKRILPMPTGRIVPRIC